MQYTRLGHSGLLVSRLSFGVMTFGTGNLPTIYKVDLDHARALVHQALDAGINFFDTANAYALGQSETMLGQILGSKRPEVVIATKVGFRMGEGLGEAGLSRRHILAQADASLQRLGTDYIDLYLVHKTDPYTPLEETLQALDDLVRSGKVRYIGFSNWPAWQAATALQMQRERGWATFCNGQMFYALLGRDVEHEVVPMMQHHGVGMTVWSPLAGGFLSGKYTPETIQAADNRLSGFDILPIDKAHGFAVVERLRTIGASLGASVAQVALAWLLTRPAVSSVLLGASKAAQLADNLGALEVALPAEVLEELNSLTAPAVAYPGWFVRGMVDPVQQAALGVRG